MREIVTMLLLLGAMMLLIAWALFGLGDASTLVSPPDAVVEGFARSMTTKRYQRALPYLDEKLAGRIGVDSLERLGSVLESRMREVMAIEGEQIAASGDTARARVRLRSTGGEELPLDFPLVRREGVWSISGLDALVRLDGR